MTRTRVSLGGVCEAVVVDSRTDRTKRARIRDNAPHSHYAIERDDIARELAAFHEVCVEVGQQPEWSVFEPFGGSGWHSALINKLVRPSCHEACDISEDCVASIRETVPGILAVQHDAFSLPESRGLSEHWTWVHADFNLLTPARLRDDPALRSLLLWLFRKAELRVTITDTSPYEADSTYNPGTGGQWLAAFTGWHHTRTWCWGPAAMHMFEPEPSGPYKLIETGIKPMDIKVLP